MKKPADWTGSIAHYSSVNHLLESWPWNLETCTELWRIDPESDKIGRSAVDSTGRFIVCSNLFDGFDIYDLDKRRYKRTVQNKYDKDQKFVLPALFINNDSDILAGSTNGKVMVVSVINDSMVSRLDHGTEVVQSIGIRIQAFVQPSKSLAYIATGSAGPGYTKVMVWERPGIKSIPQRSAATETRSVSAGSPFPPKTDCGGVAPVPHLSSPSSYKPTTLLRPTSGSPTRKINMKSYILPESQDPGRTLQLRSAKLESAALFTGAQPINRGSVTARSHSKDPTIDISPVAEAAPGGEASARIHPSPPQAAVRCILDIIVFFFRGIILLIVCGLFTCIIFSL
ncbi:hypothetical protein D9611_008263 [Ephemerocybe angulata]|uniref:Uncharacterized protein n=1 Tax=Ephemerocybe angulata TaxID=980116 RepID=A0A8H5BKU4_9AGAR|nr:hypothetical protein D9611_008263 [Tulosesus angulatus]